MSQIKTKFIEDHAITNIKFRQSAALSLVGNSTNATADVADIVAALDGQIMRRSGTTIGFGSIDLASANVVGSAILPIANGGTGQASAAAAFGALSPLTTKGDLLGFSTLNARVPVGTNGQVLTADSGAALGVSWATASSGANVFLSNLSSPTAINQDLIFDKNSTAYLKTADDNGTSGPGASQQLILASGDVTAAASGDSSGAVTLISGGITDSGSSGMTGALALGTGNNAGTGDTASVNVSTGNSAAGASGDINLITGTAVTTRGRVFANAGAVTLVSDTSIGLVASSGIEIASPATAQTLKFFEDDNNNFAGIKAPATLAADYTLTLPPDDGTPGQVLSTNGSGILSWITDSSGITQLTGDATAGPGSGSQVLTLATVNGNVGSFGSSTSIPSFTVNAKGLITAASGNAVIAPAGTLSGTTLNATVVSSSLTSVGTITTGVWNGTTIAIANGGTGQTTAAAAFNALNPMTTTGDMIYESATNVASRLPIGSTGQVLTVVAGIPAWAAAASAPTNAKETFVLSGTDITNQFITLAQTPVANSVNFMVKGAGSLLEGASYDYSVVGAQINFLNDLATGGGAALIAGDVVQVQYEY